MTDEPLENGPLEAVLDTTVTPVWRATVTLHAAILMGLAIATAGTLTSRVDVILIALPLIASAAIAIDRRPDAAGSSTLHIDLARGSGPASADEFLYRVTVQAPATTDFVHLRLTPKGSETREMILAPNSVETVIGNVPLLHSGRNRVVCAAYRLVAADGGWVSLQTPEQVAEKVVAPVALPLPSIPLPHRLIGLTGNHASVRAGDGGEFRDVHPYAPGDRLRRIDWKATARRSQGFGDLYVRRTDATSDATIIVVIDSRDDVGERVEDWAVGSGTAGLSSMDIAREAAASIATAAAGRGDRVGLHDVAAPGRLVPPGAGKRHLDKVLRRIEASEPSGGRFNRRRAPIVPAGAIVYLLSTFLDDDASSIALQWRVGGRRVIAVDILPTPRLDRSDPDTQLAYRIVMAERRRRFAGMHANGVERFRWQEDADNRSRAVNLLALARSGLQRR